MKNSLKIAFCSVVTALSIVFMFLGGVLAVFAYIMPMLCGLMTSALKKTLGTSSAWITYIATSLLSIILVSDKECMLMYIAFFGFYPIIKGSIEKIKAKSLQIIIKLVIFNVLMSAVQLMLVFVFSIPFLDDGMGKIFILLFAIMLNLLFVVYDKLLTKILIVYELKLENKIKRLIK